MTTHSFTALVTMMHLSCLSTQLYFAKLLSLSLLCRKIGGPEAEGDFKGSMSVSYKLGGVMNITVEVNNVLVNTEIHNVFGVIKGFIDPGRTSCGYLRFLHSTTLFIQTSDL